MNAATASKLSTSTHTLNTMSPVRLRARLASLRAAHSKALADRDDRLASDLFDAVLHADQVADRRGITTRPPPAPAPQACACGTAN